MASKLPRRADIWQKGDNRYAIHGVIPVEGAEGSQVVLFQRIDDDNNPSGNLRVMDTDAFMESPDWKEWVPDWWDDDYSGFTQE